MKKTYFITRNVTVEHGTRLLNYVVDYVAIMGFGALVMGLWLIANGTDEMLESGLEINKLEEYLLGVLFTLPYYFFLEVLTQRSLGKLITGTIVTDENGNRPSVGSILARTFCRVIPFDGLSFLGNNARGWHDTISKTYVVNAKKLEADKLNFENLEKLGQLEETP